MNSVQEYRFYIKFDGESVIPLQTLCVVLSEFNKLSDIATEGREKCEYSIVANLPGSFETELVAKAFIGTSLFFEENGGYIKSVLEMIKTWFEIKMHLKGGKPKKVESKDGKLHVYNQDGEVKVTNMEGNRFFENASINNCVICMGSSLLQGETKGFSILTDQKEGFLHCTKDEYPNLCSGDAILPDNEPFVSTIHEATLFVKKFVTRGDSRWEFYYTKTFQATILDTTWLNKFQKGEIEVVAGVSLVADLRIETATDTDGMPIDDTAKYYITKVYNIVFPNREEQVTL